MAIETDVCIIGGGPSGSAFAIRMTALGYRVVVVERRRFPRPHVGEALTPGTWPLLEALNVRYQVEEAGFVPAIESLVRWQDSTTRTVRSASHEPGLNVDRGRFDQIVLKAARVAGAEIVQPASAGRPRKVESGWEIPVWFASKELLVQAHFVADASGRALALGGRREWTSARTIALCGTWECPGVGGTQTRVQAAPQGWFWGAHLPDRSFKAMAFMDRDLMRRRQVSRASLESFYLELLGTSELMSGLAGARLSAPVFACDATCYAHHDPVGLSFIRLGEAAFAIDALSSAGVQKALQSALAASAVAHTLISGIGDRQAALEFYRENQRHSVKQHADWAAGYYHENEIHRDEPFWVMRAKPAAAHQPPVAPDRSLQQLLPYRVRLADEADVIQSPCIVGSHVECRAALRHPSLRRPVAYLNGVELIQLLSCFKPGSTLAEVVLKWTERMSMDSALAVADWLNRRGMLVTT
ncbi:MAG: flavin-dependent monooxygenase QhpG [Gammaproteobacteria bacterium]